jgi:hypothetical protein
MNPSERIDALIEGIADWRGKTLADVRKVFLDADKEIVEEWKWMGSPTWYRDGIIAVANAHKEKVKITFSHGAKLDDPGQLFNNGLGGSTWRAIDLLEGDKVNKAALKKLVKAAIAYNQAKAKKPAPASRKVVAKTAAKAGKTTSKTVARTAAKKAVKKAAKTKA